MMGSDNTNPTQDDDHDFPQAHLYGSRESMENLLLHEPPPHLSSNYRSAISDPLQNPNYLEPPSYSDVIFPPFDDDHSNTTTTTTESHSNGTSDTTTGANHGAVVVSGNLSRSGSLMSSSPDALTITVSNPQKEQEVSSNSLVPGGNTYVTYLVTTKTNLIEYGGAGSEFNVRRRFKDVVTLADRLAEGFRGYFIPPRPDKNVVESQVMQKQEFVEQRRVSLEKYLRRLAEHPVIRKSEELRVFLQVQGKLPLLASTDVASRMLDGAVKFPKQLFGESVSVVAPHEVVQPAKGGRDLMRIFKELKQSVANDWGGSKPPVVEEDKEFLEKKEKLQDLEQQLSNASQQAESLVKAQQDIGETMGELGLAFIKLTKFETEEAMSNSQRIRATDMKHVATAAVKASRFYRESNAQTVKHLDTLHEYLGLMLAVHGAFSDRSSALLTVQTLLSELSSLQSRAEKLEVASSKIFGGDKSRIRKLEELKETMRVTEDAKMCAVREYERIKENNRSELERLDRERHDDFLNMLKGFVVNQVGYAEKIANVWTKVAEDTSGYARQSS